MNTLRLSSDLSLPLDAATRRLAILAMSGAGKSNVAVVLAEQMFDAGVPWVAIDPKGDWWGVRSSKDGKGPGLPIPIFGGLHGDIPLEPSSGKMIGELIVEQRLTCVLDISEFEDRQKQWGFLIDLGETLLRKNRQALHLFLEEADEYLPQRTSEKGNLPKCLGVWQRVVKRGRFRGIGSTQITQRNASLNKDTLYMAEALIAMRVTGKADREAVRGWVEYHNASDEIVNSLPTLADGEAWVSSPAWLKVTKRLTFDRRRTFDSGATPVLLKGTAAPATLADVDLDKLRTKMAATIEKAKADDPIALRAELARVTKERDAALKAANGTMSAPVLKTALADEYERGYRDGAGNASRGKDLDIASIYTRLHDAHREATKSVAAATAALQIVDEIQAGITAMRRENSATATQEIPRRTPAPQRRPVERAVSKPVHSDLSRGQQKVLNALAELKALGVDAPSRHQLGMVAGYNLTGGSGAQHIADLGAAGMVEIPDKGTVRITEKGENAADPTNVPRSLDELHERVLAKLGDGQRRIAEYLISIYPESISRAELGPKVGYNLTGGSGAQHVADLVTVGAAKIPGSGKVVASDLLFPDSLT